MIEGNRRHYSTEKQLYMLAIGELRSCFRTMPSYAQFTRAIRKTMPYLDLILETPTQIKKRHTIESIFGYLKTRVSLIFPFLRTAESFIAHVKAAVLTYMINRLDPVKSYL